MENESVIKENEKRKNLLFEPYDPFMGIGSPIERSPFFIYVDQTKPVYLPVTMLNDDFINDVAQYSCLEEFCRQTGLNFTKTLNKFNEVRCNHDFEFYASTTITIQDKISKEKFKLKLRKSQRKILAILEKMRLAGEPIRVILLKARQLGGSTLIQCYFFWIQDRLKKNWHSLILADVEGQARNIRGMYTTIAEGHHREVTLTPYENSSNVRLYRERGNIIGVGSMQRPDSTRSYDYAMVHMSEVGLWKKTEGKSPEDLVQAIRGAITDTHLSAEILESTAKGLGNFFHREWLSAMQNDSGYQPIFIAWHEIELYYRELTINPIDFINSFSKYEKWLWSIGATLEGINWYRKFKRDNNYSDWRMKSEFPSTAIEAFQSTGKRFFAPDVVANARRSNRPPEFIGEMYGEAHKGPRSLEKIRFQETSNGNMKVWHKPVPLSVENVKNRYCVSVDIGGRSDGSDNSVIKAFDRMAQAEGGAPVTAAVWSGHLDFDLLAWKAIQICKWYNDAYYIPEDNKMNEKHDDTEGTNYMTILDEIEGYYENIHTRTNPEQVRQGLPVSYGFFTTKQTKSQVLNTLNAAYRDYAYFEFDSQACDEADQFEIKENGSYGAVDGAHDDHVITTAIGVWACLQHMEPVVVLSNEPKTKVTRQKTFADI